MNREIQEATREGASQEGTCGEHEDEYSFWCEPCDVPACMKCLTSKHIGCKFVLIEVKHKLRKQQEANLHLLKNKIEKYCEGLTICNENLASVRSLVEKLQSVEMKLLDYQTNVKAWKTEAQKLLSYSSDSPSALPKVTKQQDSEQKNSQFLEEFEMKIRARPTSVLLHVAATYQISGDDTDAFVVALQSSVEARRAEGPSGDENLAAKCSKQSFQEAVSALTEGEDWVVSDATSAAAVQSVLKTTSVRPAGVKIASNNIPDELLAELQSFFKPGKQYPVEASETLPSFPISSVLCSETRAYSTARLDAWTAPAGWCSLTQFWGHLDAAAVTKLPATITSVGLVLRDQEDMAALNALLRAAIDTRCYTGNRSCLRWPRWTDLNLSVAKTFRLDHWKLTWQFRSYNDYDEWDSTNLSLLTDRPNLGILSNLGVRLRLQLPHLMPGDRPWMGDLYRVMELRGGSDFRDPVPLILPGARIDPDSLLGVLRDSGQCWEVHLPTSMPQQGAREEMAKKYMEHGHCVTWDLE